ncbi:MAG: dual specificity protein phosphatase family protein [Candidatus Hodarchaeota archaeon]
MENQIFKKGLVLLESERLSQPNENIKFIKWVIEGKLAGSSFPITHELLSLLKINVKLVINLTRRDIPNKLKERLRKYGVEFKRLPIRDFGTPDKITIKHYLQSVCETINKGGAVLIHCIAGCGRTGTMIGLFLVSHGYSPDKAINLIHNSLGTNCPETNSQIELLYKQKEKCPNLSVCNGLII